ncbi:MAG: hypothetical protein AABW59_04805 [archaeon]
MDIGNETNLNMEAKEVANFFGTNLSGVYSYGTRNKKFFVVLKKLDTKLLDDVKAKLRPKRKLTLITENEIKLSADSSPYTLSQVSMTAQLLSGTNILGKVKIDKKRLLKDAERELMLSMIQFRHAYIDAGLLGKRSLLSFIPAQLRKIVRAILFAKGVKSKSMDEDLAEIEKMYKIERKISGNALAKMKTNEKLFVLQEFLEELFEKIQ